MRTVLVIDSSRAIRVGLISYLHSEAKEEMEIYEASSLKSAKTILSEHRVEFIITNLFLVDSESISLIRELLSSSKSKIIVLTSNDEPKVRDKLFQIGIYDYFSKHNPINFIVNQILKLIYRHSLNRDIDILIVDDSRMVRDYISFIFKNRNYNTLVAKDGKEALDILNSLKIDLIILDLEMPILTGEELVYNIKRDENFLEMPILAISSTKDKNLILRVLKSGANDFLNKPFSIEILIFKVESLLNISRIQKSLRVKHKQIVDSINYSAMIQNSILPLNSEIENEIEDYFILWEPKSTVGGDIYQFEKFKDGFLLFVIDCTGHGVAGAFMTMIVKTALDGIINLTNYKDPALILKKLNSKIKATLKQDNSQTLADSGLDGGVLFFDKIEREVIYSGAKTPLFAVVNENLRVIESDRYSIGYKSSNNSIDFTNYSFKLNSKSYLYISTDGFLDQTGGKKGFSFGKSRFKRLILENYRKNFKIQKEIFSNALIEYQKDEDRCDDLTLIGFKL